LKTEEDAALYLAACREAGDEELFGYALQIVARARVVARLKQERRDASEG
jgi:DNA-binding phage protein